MISIEAILFLLKKMLLFFGSFKKTSYLCEKFRCDFFRNNNQLNNRQLWLIHWVLIKTEKYEIDDPFFKKWIVKRRT